MSSSNSKPAKLVFIIDDDVSIREILTLTISDTKIPVKSFASGKEAILASKKLQPDVVFLDYYLPGEKTEEILSSLNELSSHPKVYIMSADVNALKKVKHLQIESFLAKPFYMEDVLRALGIS